MLFDCKLFPPTSGPGTHFLREETVLSSDPLSEASIQSPQSGVLPTVTLFLQR